MEILDAVRAAIKELVIPELDGLKSRLVEVQGRVEAQAEAIRTLNGHLVDQSRRIDAIREELNARLDATNARIDTLREELIRRLDATNQRIDRLYEVIVRREEHDQLARRLQALEQEVGRIKERLAMT